MTGLSIEWSAWFIFFTQFVNPFWAGLSPSDAQASLSR
jgi:hypothetical protein